ncbi:MAG: ABC transporter substrate-binding protein [Candidatus Hodarchaeales archaeon]|jgi:ABC-type transport system substrate-binding protein
MRLNKKIWLGIFISLVFMTFIWQGVADVSADIAQSERKPDSYWLNNQGYIDRIVFKVITSDELMVQALRAGEIDIVGQFVDVSLITQSDLNDPNMGLTQTRRRGFGHITFNTENFPTNIRALRQGMAYALDKVELQQRALGGASFTADVPIVSSQGIWSCEYELADCEFPGGETYYEARPGIGNTTVLAQGWYDHDGDGWREFYNGTTADWDGPLVSQQHGTANYDEDYNGYTYKGMTFGEVAGASGPLLGTDSGEDLLAEAYKAGPWIEEGSYNFDITGSAGASIIISTVVTMSVEAFHSIGIQVDPSFITFSTLLADETRGDFHAVFYAHSNLGPNPLFLNAFTSDAIDNLEGTRWVNSTFDENWDIIESSTDLQAVLEAAYKCQQIYWQEQPKVVMYNNELTSMYRTNKFMGQVTVPGTGGFGYWSLAKMHLNEEFKGDNNYPDWPIGGTLFFGLPQPMGSQNTWWDNNAYTQAVLNMIEEGIGLRHPQDLSWMTGAAITTDHEILAPCNTADCVANNADGGTRMIFKIRQGVTWHDGDPFTPEDVAFSFDRLYEEESPVFYDGLTNLQATSYNDTHVTVYSNSSGLFEYDRMQIAVYKKDIWDNTPDDDPINFLNSVPVGTGPYKWQSRTPGEFVVISRNEDYYLLPTPGECPDCDEPTEPTTTEPTTTEPATTDTTPSDTTTDDEGNGAAPGFEVLVTAFGMFAIGTVVIRRRRK